MMMNSGVKDQQALLVNDWRLVDHETDVEDSELPFYFEKEFQSIDEVPTKDLCVLQAGVDVIIDGTVLKSSKVGIISVHDLVAKDEAVIIRCPSFVDSFVEKTAHSLTTAESAQLSSQSWRTLGR